MQYACGVLTFFFVCLPIESGFPLRSNKQETKKTLVNDYSPFIGSSYVDQRCMVI